MNALYMIQLYLHTCLFLIMIPIRANDYRCGYGYGFGCGNGNDTDDGNECGNGCG